MDQSRSRFSARRHGVREARDVTGHGDAGGDGNADGNAAGNTDGRADVGAGGGTARRGADSWDPFDSSERAVPDSYTRSSEQAGRRSKRKTEARSGSGRGPNHHGSDHNGPDHHRSRTDDFSTDCSNSSNPDIGSPDQSAKPKRSLKGRALAYLSRRDYSRVELAGKLRPYVEESDTLDAMLDALEQEGWLSDTRFAESLMHRRSARFGTSRIVGELKRHAVDGELLAQLNSQLRETEAARAKAVWLKKFGELPQSPAERAKQARFLAARGFSHAAIGRLLRGFDDEPEFPDGDPAD